MFAGPLKVDMGSVLKSIRSWRAWVFLLAMAAISCGLAAQQTVTGGSGHDFDAIDVLMQAAVAKGSMPGGVVIIGHKEAVVYRKAFGSRSLEPTREAMTADTIFDLASLTKVIATTTAVMQLVDEGRVRIDDPVAAYLPEFAQNGKSQITVRELMTHFSGLPPDLELKEAWHGRDTAFKMAMQVQPTNPPGTKFVYSDINFEVLGFIVQKVTGMPLNEYTATHVFVPLDMTETAFLPPASWVPRIAPTQYDEDGIMLRGVVHDPTARRMGGVAGHAGLFSTADDLAKFAQNLLSDHPKVLTRKTIEEMSTPQQPGSGSILRGLGWDIDSPYSGPRGKLFPVGSFGHTGFTGTYSCIGGVNVREDAKRLEAGAQVVVGTPGRVFDMMNRGILRTDNIKLFILDEADDMLSLGFKNQIYEIFQLLPPNVQVVLVSATMPEEVLRVSQNFMRDPVRILSSRETS